MTSALLPLHLSLAGRRVTVIGGGPVAWRKARTALAAGALVQVIAPAGCPELVGAAALGRLGWLRRPYAGGDLAAAWLVFTATGDPATDDAVEREAESLRTFCVRASTGHRRGTRSPAVLRRAEVTISVSSSDDVDPRRAVAIRDAVGAALDSGDLPVRSYRSA